MVGSQGLACLHGGDGWRRKAVMVGLIHSSWSWCLRERKDSEV